MIFGQPAKKRRNPGRQLEHQALRCSITPSSMMLSSSQRRRPSTHVTGCSNATRAIRLGGSTGTVYSAIRRYFPERISGRQPRVLFFSCVIGATPMSTTCTPMWRHLPLDQVRTRASPWTQTAVSALPAGRRALAARLTYRQQSTHPHSFAAITAKNDPPSDTQGPRRVHWRGSRRVSRPCRRSKRHSPQRLPALRRSARFPDHRAAQPPGSSVADLRTEVGGELSEPTLPEEPPLRLGRPPATNDGRVRLPVCVSRRIGDLSRSHGGVCRSGGVPPAVRRSPRGHVWHRGDGADRTIHSSFSGRHAVGDRDRSTLR